jgi:protein-tyrosine phosphatase
MLTSLVLLHDNFRPHTNTVTRTRELLEHFNWELFDHIPYSPELCPSDYQPIHSYLSEELVEITAFEKY